MLSKRSFYNTVLIRYNILGDNYKASLKHQISLFPLIRSNFLANERLLDIGGGEDR